MKEVGATKAHTEKKVKKKKKKRKSSKLCPSTSSRLPSIPALILLVCSIMRKQGCRADGADSEIILTEELLKVAEDLLLQHHPAAQGCLCAALWRIC